MKREAFGSTFISYARNLADVIGVEESTLFGIINGYNNELDAYKHLMSDLKNYKMTHKRSKKHV